jgi:spermidine synthase
MQILGVLYVCFFLSGSTALVYEVVWVRLLALTFGNTVYAVGIVLAAYMSGLSLGSYLLGRWADRQVNLLKGYGFLEIGIAFFALLSPYLLKVIAGSYLFLHNPDIPLWTLSALRYLLSAAVLLVPTTMMGGTLPVLSRYFIRSETQIERRLGGLYSINTLGGVIGTFLVGFILMRHLGLDLTIKVTAALNVLIGLTSIYMGSIAPGHEITSEARQDASPDRPAGYRYAVFAFFVSGVTAMQYEVAWSRLLVGVIGSTTYAFSLILMGFLLGIGLGSLIVSYVSGRKRLDLFHFSIIQLLIGVSCFVTLLLFRSMPLLMHQGIKFAGESYSSILAVEFILVLVYTLVPTTLFGATLPIIAAVYSGGENHRGKNIGNIYAANTAGCILGSVVTAFFLLPEFGSTFSIKAAVLLNVLIGLGGLIVMRRTLVLAFAACLLALPLLPAGISLEALDSGVAVYGHKPNFQMEPEGEFTLFAKEGLHSTVSVTMFRSGNIALKVNGKYDASTGNDMGTQLALGYFPMLLHRSPEDVLLIGYGSGATARAVNSYPTVRNVHVVEIEPAVMEASEFFESVNDNVNLSPGVDIIVDDARSYIIASGETYDVIVSEPSNPWISGIGNLFSKDFYETARSRLDKNGIFCQWVQLYGLRQEDFMMILKTFSTVFPQTTIWQTSLDDAMLIGLKEPHHVFDYGDIKDRLKGKLGRDLKAYLNISGPIDFLSYFVTDAKGTRAMSAGAGINTDDLPLLEFNAPYSLYDIFSVVHNNKLLAQYLKVPAVSGHADRESLVSEFYFSKLMNLFEHRISSSPISFKGMLGPEHLALITQKIQARKGLENEAIYNLENLSRKYPDNPRVYYELGTLHENRDVLKAMNYFEKAVSLNPEEYGYVYKAARAQLEGGNIGKALDYFLRAYKLPHRAIEDSDIFLYTGLCLEQLSDYESTSRYLDRSIEANPYSVDALLASAGLLLDRLGKPGLACEKYKRAFEVAGRERKHEIGEYLRDCRKHGR